MKVLTEDEARGLLRNKIGYSYTQTAMARDAGVTHSFVSMVLSGKTTPTEKLLSLVGVTVVRRVDYVVQDD